MASYQHVKLLSSHCLSLLVYDLSNLPICLTSPIIDVYVYNPTALTGHKSRDDFHSGDAYPNYLSRTLSDGSYTSSSHSNAYSYYEPPEPYRAPHQGGDGVQLRAGDFSVTVKDDGNFIVHTS